MRTMRSSLEFRSFLRSTGDGGGRRRAAEARVRRPRIGTLPFPAPRRRSGVHTLVLVALLSTTACGGGTRADADPDAGVEDGASRLRYDREFIFIGSSGDEPVVVPFTFRAIEADEGLERAVQAWLGRGDRWDRFLDEQRRTSSAGGVWRVVPLADLLLTAGGPAEVESLGIRRGDRRLRLELGSPLTDWTGGGGARFRLLEGLLTVGSELIPGSVLEILGAEPTLSDGWPPGQDFDWVFLTDATGEDSIQLVLADGLGGPEGETQYAWVRSDAGESVWPQAEVRWLEMRALAAARRQIPTRWTFRVPPTALEGEVEAAGFDALLGPQRGPGHAIEIRYSVRGWVEVEGTRREVVGMVRHTQR